jgi:acyl-CoA synthetase (AMP-forming)/AMP-acid ligase II
MSGRISPPPSTQALNSATFVSPPLDLRLTVAEIVDFHRTHSPNHVVFVFEDSPGRLEQITFYTWICAIHRAGRNVRNLFQLPEPQVGGVKPIITLLANSGKRCLAILHPAVFAPNHLHLDTLTYGTTMLGIIRAEYVAFAVSHRNSAGAVAHLIDKTGSQHVLVTADLKPVMEAAAAILKERGVKTPVVQLIPTFGDLFPDDHSDNFQFLPEPKLKGLDDPVCILHSSGTSITSLVYDQHPERCVFP